MASIVQVASASASTESNLSVTFGSPVTGGNAIYCLGSCVVGAGLGVLFTFSDGQGDVFTMIDRQTDLDATPMSNSVAFNVAGGITTVSMALDHEHIGSDLVSQMIVAEVSGIYALDPGNPPSLLSHVINVNNAWPTPGDLLDLSTISAGLDNPFIIVGIQSVSDPANVYTAGAGYTLNAQIATLWNSSSNLSCLGIESGNFSTAGFYTPTIIGSQSPGFSSFWGINAVTAFATSSTPPPPPPPAAPRCSDVELSGTMNTLELTRDLDADWKSDSTFIITQDEPLPFTLRGIVLHLTYEPD